MNDINNIKHKEKFAWEPEVIAWKFYYFSIFKLNAYLYIYIIML